MAGCNGVCGILHGGRHGFTVNPTGPHKRMRQKDRHMALQRICALTAASCPNLPQSVRQYISAKDFLVGTSGTRMKVHPCLNQNACFGARVWSGEIRRSKFSTRKVWITPRPRHVYQRRQQRMPEKWM